jgi:hypothetical protein
MENWLKRQVTEYEAGCGWMKYVENISPLAIKENEWLDANTSWIYKVGVLVVGDTNKMDWVTVYIAKQRNEREDYDLIGKLYFNQGENDDMSKVLARVYACLNMFDVGVLNDLEKDIKVNYNP